MPAPIQSAACPRESSTPARASRSAGGEYAAALRPAATLKATGTVPVSTSPAGTSVWLPLDQMHLGTTQRR